MGAELRGLGMRCERIADRVCAAGRDQDADPEPQLREPRVGPPDSDQHGQERGHHRFLQGIDAEAADDGAEAGVQLLVGADADSGVWAGCIDRSVIDDGWMGGLRVVGVLGQIFNSITCQRNNPLLLSRFLNISIQISL